MGEVVANKVSPWKCKKYFVVVEGFMVRKKWRSRWGRVVSHGSQLLPVVYPLKLLPHIPIKHQQTPTF